jgi:membrane protease subunit (stomatin/prohibitin family)
MSTLKGWKYGFHSPFKAEVYFVNTRQFTDMKWGTQNPIIVRDPEFGMVRLRAFGAFSLRVTDPTMLLRELAGTDPQFRTEEVSEYLRQLIVGKLAPALASSGVPMLDLATHQGDIGDKLATALSLELHSMGLQVPKFIIENISLPPEVEAAIDKRSQMGVLGNLDQYTKFQTANAIEDAANNEGGAGAGLGVGLGMGLGQAATAAMHQQAQQPAGPPPLPPAEQWFLGANGQQLGPFDRNGLSQQVAGGTLTASTLVWRNGMAAWVAASQVPELTSLFGAVPPPLPPQA